MIDELIIVAFIRAAIVGAAAGILVYWVLG
jgi:hypothetical protein